MTKTNPNQALINEINTCNERLECLTKLLALDYLDSATFELLEREQDAMEETVDLLENELTELELSEEADYEEPRS